MHYIFIIEVLYPFICFGSFINRKLVLHKVDIDTIFK